MKSYTSLRLSPPILSVLALILTILAGSPPAHPETGPASGPESCRTCHRDLYQRAIKKPHVHPPFHQRQCAVCHLLDESRAEFLQEVEQKPKTPGRIRWIGESPLVAGQHWFALPARNLNSVLVTKTRDSRSSNSKPARIPSLDELYSLTNHLQPPKISSIRLLEIRKGLFLSATIGWETDSIADSAVIYGIKGKNQITPRSNSLNREHQVTITGLQANRQYQYSVVSRDIFGNESVSETHTFSTSKPVAVPQQGGTGHPDRGDPDTEMESQFSRYNDNYLIQVSVHPPAPVLIGTDEPAGGQDPGGPRFEVSAAPVIAHAGIEKTVGIMFENCESCHQVKTQSLSHPVNVYPKQGMIIPKEYRTLPDGRIICLSCHDPHASNYQYLLIKSSKRELCIGCHPNFP